MLEYCKVILTKMSFDSRLFAKELRKALSYLNHEERQILKEWCYAQFYPIHATILRQFLGGI